VNSAVRNQATSPAAARYPLGRLLRSAVRPRLAGELARVRRTEARLAGRSPAPMVVGVLGVNAQAGTSTVTALVAQALAALAPGRVAVLDADGLQQHQRIRLGAGHSGGLRQLLTSPYVWHSRRVVDQYLDHAGAVPVLAVASAERSEPVLSEQVDLAVRLLRRRFPTVVADLPPIYYQWAAEAADHLIVVGSASVPLRQATEWLLDNRPERDRDSLTVVAARVPFASPPDGVDLAFPIDPALGEYDRVRLADIALPTLAVVEEIVCRLMSATNPE
jgi:Flp pilus assembly CpaE family ATPase